MAILIDPPVWPAHGTLFSHLVSDSSLAELRDFAHAAGLPAGAFDEDHYDVPERRYAQLVALGARPVDGGALVRALIRSGLRVPARERSKALFTPLLHRWSILLPGHAPLGVELLERWAEPHRRYHTRAHLLAVLEALERIAGDTSAEAPRAVVLAAWFHDAVYTGAPARPGQDEEDSARLAEERLTEAGLPDAEIAEVARLVRLTASHAPEADDDGGRLLCDADLSVLGRDPRGYHRYTVQVREEHAHVPDDAFRAGRAAVLEHLLRLEPLFHTGRARDLWLEPARENLGLELSRLRGGGPLDHPIPAPSRAGG